jgi:hypothetical protein
MKNIILIASLFVCVQACNTKEEIVTGLVAVQDCKAQAPFIGRLGFPTNTSAISTSEKKTMGVALIDAATPIENRRIYQEESWKKFGSMGPIAITESGTIYLAPVPFVNVLDNKREDQNKLFTIDANTAVMTEVINFGTDAKKNSENGYGVMGLGYDCDNHLLYVSSVAGSDKSTERGTIYCLDVKTNPATIVDKLINTDAMGLGVAFFNDKKRLFYGNARNHTIYSIELKEDGKFSNNLRKEFTLSDIGPRGDDVARKIKFTPEGQMIVTGIQFYYNLTAPTQKQESVYTFTYDVSKAEWIKLAEENKNIILGY